MKKMKKRRNRAKKIYTRKVIIDKNNYYKIFAKFFNRWRGRILAKSKSSLEKEFNLKIINVNNVKVK